MYAQVALKSNTLRRNGASCVVMRGMQKCTCAGASLRDRNALPLCCIIYGTATDCCCGMGYSSIHTNNDWIADVERGNTKHMEVNA